MTRKLLGMSRRIRVPRVKASRRLGIRAPGGIKVPIIPGAVARPAAGPMCANFGRELPAGVACPPGCKLASSCFQAFVKVMP